MLEVIRAICVEQDLDWSELERIRQEKAAERGGFEKRIVLEAVRE